MSPKVSAFESELRQLAAERIAVGPDVAGEHKPVVRTDDFGESGPVDGHNETFLKFRFVASKSVGNSLCAVPLEFTL